MSPLKKITPVRIYGKVFCHFILDGQAEHLKRQPLNIFSTLHFLHYI